MAARFTPLVAGPRMIAFSIRRAKAPRVEKDFEALLARMLQRLYPETMPVLASYWLKTVYASGYDSRSWRELNRQLKRVLAERLPNEFSRQAIVEIQTWVQQTLLTGQAPQSLPPRLGPLRPSLISERLAPYVGRILNEWLPVEVAHLLVNESESSITQSDGIPVLAIGKALERLLVRERLSPGTLEQLLQPELLSPQYVYPAHVEILRDVILSLLGRTEAPPPCVMPATLLGVAPDSPLPALYREAVRHAFLAPRPGGEEVHVPISPAQALEILNGAQVRIGSIIVTMNGSWWESEKLQSGEQCSVVYRPMGRLRIDYSEAHASLRVPWPETRWRWSGATDFRNTFEIFGCEWHVSQWEQDAERTWLRLAFSRPLRETAPASDTGFRRLRPASVDIAWTALENALTSSITEKSREPIERLRHSDLIPLGRAIFGLTESVMSRRLRRMEAIETRLRAIRYLEAQAPSTYGRVPWRILPAPVRAALFRVRIYPALLDLVNEVFDALPEALSGPASQSPSAADKSSTSPPHAA
jgi:hypothetical protein